MATCNFKGSRSEPVMSHRWSHSLNHWMKTINKRHQSTKEYTAGVPHTGHRWPPLTPRTGPIFLQAHLPSFGSLIRAGYDNSLGPKGRVVHRHRLRVAEAF